MEVVVGRIGRPHGITGWVTVDVRTDDPEGRFAPGTTVLTDPVSAGPLTIADGRIHSGRLLLMFEGYGDRGAAERLRGVLLVADVDPDERPADPEEYFDHQLVGIAVRTVDGDAVGDVREVFHLPGQDVLAVTRPDGGEVLVPFVREIVPTVDLDAREILVDPPPGLLGEDVDDVAAETEAGPPA